MIKLLRGEPCANLPASHAGATCLFAARIETQALAYHGMREAPDLYLTNSGALLSHFDGVLTVSGEQFDPTELRQFIRMCGCHTVVCGGAAAQRLGLAGDVTVGTIMRYAGGATEAQACVCHTPKLDDVFALLQTTFENMHTAVFDAWYCDISLKQRRGLAYVYAVYEAQGAAPVRGSLCATAGVYYQNAATAVIGSVATREDRRGHGLAAQILGALIARIQAEGKLPQIVCQNDRAHVLYRRLGFVDTGKFFEIRVR